MIAGRWRPGDAPLARFSPAAGVYVRAWKRGKAVTAAGGTIRMDWAGRDLDAEAFDRVMRRALDRRISARVPGFEPLGRKVDPDYERILRLEVDQLRRLRQHRVWPAKYRWSTPLLQRRYGHLLERERC